MAITEDDIMREVDNALDPNHPDYDPTMGDKLEEIGRLKMETEGYRRARKSWWNRFVDWCLRR